MKGYFIAWVFVIALCMAIIHNNPVAADTNVSGYISADTTWTSANSPYVAEGNVVVSSGVTLTIEPGVTVKFDVGKSLQIDGKLIAKGSGSERITFTKNGSDNWGYILFNDSSTDASFDSSGSYTSGSTLEYCIVEYAGGTSVSGNGAVRMNNAHPFINYCTINNNSASGIYGWNLSGTLKITNSTITNNTSSSNGGGIYCVGGTKTISNNTISNNTASSSASSTIYGGGIYCKDGTNTISGNTISNNSVSNSRSSYNGFGGGVSCYGGTNTISNNTITNNTSDDDGGGVHCYNATNTISSNTITGNTASDDGGSYAGGGILCSGGTTTISNNIISNNKASGYGGGINCYRGTNTIKNNLITNNTSTDYGGGIMCGDSGTHTISNNIITGNTASDSGGGIYCGGGTFTISQNHVARNSASKASGIRYYSSTDGKDFNYNLFTGNTSTGTSSTYTVFVSSRPLFNYNNLTDNTATYELWNDNAYGSSNLDAKNNWWGVTDDSSVQGKIYDWIDDSTKGTVNYYPYGTSTNTAAPISPPTNLTITESSDQITVNWSANSESDTAGYIVYWDTDSGHSYTNSANVGNVTNHTITGLSLTTGRYYVTVTAYDANYNSSNDLSDTITNENQTNGYESYYATEKVVGETTAPTAGTLNINSGAAYTNSATVTLSLSATDNIGVTGYYVSNSSTTPSASSSGWTSIISTASYVEDVSYTLIGGDGSKTVYVWYKDAAGNISSAVNDSITLDTTVPTVTITSPTSSSTHATTSSTVSLGGSASDSTSGITSVTWSNDVGGSGTASGTTSWSVSSISLSSGSNVITVTVTDGAGNTGTDTITVTADTVPTGSVSINSGASYTNSTAVTLTLAASDTIGVAGYYVSNSSTSPSASSSGWASIASTTNYSENVSFTLNSSNGTRTAYAWFKDTSGSISSTASDSIILDTVVPTITITSPTSSITYTASDSTISLSGIASDSTSGINSVTWSSSAGGSGTAEGTTSWTISNISLSSGDTVITVTVTDNAGNAGTDAITIQYTIPTPTPQPSPTLSLTPVPSPTLAYTPTLLPSPTPQVSPSPVGDGIVFGIVNDQDELPLKGVTITITGKNSSDSTETDEYGFYEFGGLVKGDYTLTYEKEGFLDQTQDISLEEGEVKGVDTVTMEQFDASKIYGYVVNIKGSPIEFVRLRLKGIKTKVIKTASSDADGFFEFTDLETDTYIIFAKKKGYRKNQQKVKLGEGESTEIEIEMKKTSKRIKGLLLEEDVQ